MKPRHPANELVHEVNHHVGKVVAGIVATAALLVWAGLLRGQAPPEPPVPPAPPDPGQIFVLNETPHLGVSLSDVSAAKAQELKLSGVTGAYVNSVQKGSAAAKAGIQPGDVILEFDGTQVRSSAELRRLIRETPSGRNVDIEVMRNGKSLTLNAKLEASALYGNIYPPPEVHIPEINIPPMNFSGLWDRRATLGISGDDLTPQLAGFFGVAQGKGVLVSEVTKGGAADKAGLKAGDVIVAVNAQPVRGVDELRDLLNQDFVGDTRKVSLTVVRDHHQKTFDAELTRPHPDEWHNSTALRPDDDPNSLQMQARALAEQAKQFASQQRAMVHAEEFKEQQEMKGEWQRELQQQMRSLKDQLQQMQNMRVMVNSGGDI